MSHCEFEAGVKIDCVREIVSILRSGDIDKSKSMQIVEHAACFLGSGAKMLRGEEKMPDVIGSAGSDLADDLEAALSVAEDNAQVAGAVPWILIARMLIPILIDLFTEE